MSTSRIRDLADRVSGVVADEGWLAGPGDGERGRAPGRAAHGS